MPEAVLEQVAAMADVPEVASGRARGSRSLADDAMDRYADGDETAFGTLYDELAPRLFRFALRLARSRPAAEDVVQQTFLQLHASRDRFVRGAAVLTWAYAIARRLLIDASRRGVREVLDGGLGDGGTLDGGPGNGGTPAPALAADDALAQHELARSAREDLARLPDALRESFVLVKLEGLSVAEAAEVLGISQANVKIRTWRARVALERALGRTARIAGGSTP